MNCILGRPSASPSSSESADGLLQCGPGDYDPLRLDHLYALDLQNCSSVDNLEVDRFEEVTAEEVQPAADWTTYDEEHSYPLRPLPSLATMGLPDSEWLMLGLPATTTNTRCGESTLFSPPSSPTCALPCAGQVISLNVDKLAVLFSDVQVKIQPAHIASVIRQLGQLDQNQPRHSDVISGPIDPILRFLLTCCSSIDDAEIAANEETAPEATVSIPVELVLPQKTQTGQAATSESLSSTQVITRSGRTAQVHRLAKRPLTTKYRYSNKKMSNPVNVKYRCFHENCDFTSWRLSCVLKHIKDGAHGDQYSEVCWTHRCSQCLFTSGNLSSMHRHIATVHRDHPTTGSRSASTERIPTSIASENIHSHETRPREGTICKVNSTVDVEKIPSAKFACPDCASSFTRSDSLLDHRRSKHPLADGQHAQNQQRLVFSHVCRHCGKKFKRKALLLDHELGHHEKQARHTCNLCPRRFLSRANLRWHQRRHHDNTAPVYACPLCDKKLSTSTWLKRHLATQHLPA